MFAQVPKERLNDPHVLRQSMFHSFNSVVPSGSLEHYCSLPNVEMLGYYQIVPPGRTDEPTNQGFAWTLYGARCNGPGGTSGNRDQ